MDALAQVYLRSEYALSATAVVALMFGMGATLRRSDFHALVAHPEALWAGLALQWLAVPLLALALIRAAALSPGVALGLLLIAAVPGGSLSNAATWLARGNVALSVALTLVCTLACPLVVPIVIALGGASIDLRAIPMAAIASEVGLWMAPPLLAGMVVRSRWPRRADRIARASVAASLVALAAVWSGGAIASGGDDGLSSSGTTIAAAAALAMLSAAGGCLAGRVIGAPAGDRAALVIEAAYRNLGLAFLLKASMFPASDVFSLDVLLVLVAYGPFAFVPVAAVVIVHRYVGSPPRA